MAIVTESSHSRRLKKFNIKTRTKYKSGDKILYRNSDNVNNDDVKDGIILEKSYYKDNVLLKNVAGFDSRITYTFVLGEEINSNCSCPNCGYHGSASEFIDGCAYCGTSYNINYLDKNLGSKFHYDRIINSSGYKIITLIIDLLVSFVISYFYIINTSRTFNVYDLSKVLIYTTILGLFLYYIFYIVDAYIVLLPIKVYKDMKNKKQILFWKKISDSGVDKNIFFNNFNYELKKYYYEDDSNCIIDYDIVDYVDFSDQIYKDNLEISIVVDIRLVKYFENKIKVDLERKTFILRKANLDRKNLKGGINIIYCPGCGNSFDVEKGKCEYCGTKINYLQEWYLLIKR